MRKLLGLLLAITALAACSTGTATTGAPGGAVEGLGPGAYGLSKAGLPAQTIARDAATGTAAAAPAQQGVPVPQAFDPERSLILTANVSLRAKDAWSVADRVEGIAAGLGGGIMGLSQAGGGDTRTANLIIRVPSAKFNEALRQIRDVADVEVVSSAVDGKDVTDQFVDLEARLTAKKLEESRYQAILGQAKTIDEILKVDQALASVRTQIEQLTGQLNSIKQRTSFSTITVSVAPLLAKADVVPAPGGAYDPAKTVERALAALVAILHVGLDLSIWLLVFGWIPLIALGAFAVAQRSRRPAPTTAA